MLAGVVCDIQDLQILNPVVSPVTVSMVDVLPLGKFAAKMSLHNTAMLKYVLAASCDLNVSVSADSPSLLSPRHTAASHRTESRGRPLGPAGFDAERSSTSFAGAIDHR